ncbi:MAG: VacJ family lipoprotein [Proteobacteria bacterium]|nr:VacJ family lipoprotein [Pseudomonadota bacterium]
MSVALVSLAALTLATAAPDPTPDPTPYSSGADAPTAETADPSPAQPLGEAGGAFAPRDMAADPPAPPELAPGEEALGTFASDDPFEPFNRAMYLISWPVDQLVLRPLALTYKAIIPHPLRDGARNALANIYMPTTFVNDLAQGNPRQAIQSLGRFVINSTLGAAGLFDVAKRKPFNLPPQGNSFANTLGYYGADAGPYLYLPVVGPTTMRELVGNVVDAFSEPLLLNRVTSKRVVQVKTRKVSLFSSNFELSTQGAAVVIVGGLDHRAEADADLEALRHGSVDTYAALRSSFLQNRAGEIAALRPGAATAPPPELVDPLADPAGKPADKPAKGQ